MAARWGAGEETLTACNLEFFPMDTLDETEGLSAGETLEVLQSCLDPSILSIFDETAAPETKGLDEESEATLLTALTEILDNVDDENLSPFDTLPDSELLSGQKGREHSPLRRLLCLSRSPPEKDAPCGTRPNAKNLSRMQTGSLQRSDGEEDDDSSLNLSPVGHVSSPDSDLLDWGGETLPLPSDDDGLSLSLGELVRHMHPYCMAICMEDDDGEQMLPEGGILLEVVDQGENGETILAIPDFPVSSPLEEEVAKKEQKLENEAEEDASDSSELIVVDDDDYETTVNEVHVKAPPAATPDPCTDVIDETKRRKGEVREKSPSRRKKKSKEERRQEPVEGRVLRSGKGRKTEQEAPAKSEKKSAKKEKRHKTSKVTLSQTPPLPSSSPSPMKAKIQNSCKTKTHAETTTTAISTPCVPTKRAPLKETPEKSRPSCQPTATSSLRADDAPRQPAPEKLTSPAVPAVPVSPESPAATVAPAAPEAIASSCEGLPPVAAAVVEPKPKPLSLAEYRRLRQQKKPAPVDNGDGNSTKWPSLPEPPKELPPIPCLPDPCSKGPRCFNPPAAKGGPDDVKPAWQPRGPCAPPTPEALLAPPAYMVASSSKVPKPQPNPETPKPSVPEQTPAPVPAPAKELPAHQNTIGQPAAALKQATRLISSDNKCSPALSGGNEKPRPLSSTSPEHTRITTGSIKPSTVPSVLQQRVPNVTDAISSESPVTVDDKSCKLTDGGTELGSTPAARPSDSRSPTGKPVVLETKLKPTAAVKLHKAKCPTQELIEAFTSEIGIEAADLTSLLEQFEETQAKEEYSVPEVSGRAAAVGNSSCETAPEKTLVERVRANDLSSTAALTPPATPPHHMWRPLAPIALQGKSKAAEASKSNPSKIIQIEPRPLPSSKSRSKPALVVTVDPELACLDHDYCLPAKGTSPGEHGRRWNVKQQSHITIKPITQPTTTTQTTSAAIASPVPSTVKPAVPRTDVLGHSSVLETPDASPARHETESSVKGGSPRKRSCERSYRRRTSSRTPSPSPKERTGGRSRKRRSRRSPSPMSSGSESDSHSSRSGSRSRVPAKKRYRPRNSESSSSSSSRSSSRSSHSSSHSPPRGRRRRYSYSSSHSGSWSRSRSRSRSPHSRRQRSESRPWYSPSYGFRNGHGAKLNTEQIKQRKQSAIEERRVVYVGRIRSTMTQKELKERFCYFGEIEDCTLHFREHGDNYGFVTYYDTKHAFNAIENGSRLRKPDELPFDLCFGGRRQFCQTGYADLDSKRDYEPEPVKGKFHAIDFDTLLRQAKQNQKR